MTMARHRASPGMAPRKVPDVKDQAKVGMMDEARSQADESLESHAAGPQSPASQSDESTDAADAQRRSLSTLEAIRDLLDRQHRKTKQHDFSLLRLFGALLQMFAVVAGLWGVASILDDAHAAATARLALASFLQLASISIFAIDRFR